MISAKPNKMSQTLLELLQTKIKHPDYNEIFECIYSIDFLREILNDQIECFNDNEFYLCELPFIKIRYSGIQLDIAFLGKIFLQVFWVPELYWCCYSRYVMLSEFKSDLIFGNIRYTHLFNLLPDVNARSFFSFDSICEICGNVIKCLSGNKKPNICDKHVIM